jgi:hypothetical protein
MNVKSQKNAMRWRSRGAHAEGVKLNSRGQRPRIRYQQNRLDAKGVQFQFDPSGRESFMARTSHL